MLWSHVRKEHRMKRIHVGAALVAACLCWESMAMAQGRSLGADSQGKRYMGTAKEALADFQSQRKEDTEGTFELPLEAEEALTERTFPEFHARWLRRLFAVGADGAVVQIGAYGPNGKPRRLNPTPAGAKPATAEQSWGILTKKAEFIVPVKVERPCTFCDGERWVIYFPEEVKEVQAFLRKYHSAHDGYKRKNGYWEPDKGEEQERLELSTQAPEYGWEGALCTKESHLRTQETSGRSSDQTSLNYVIHSCWGCRYGVLSCCWTKVHQASLKRWRHPCPICRGKKVEVAVKYRRYRVAK